MKLKQCFFCFIGVEKDEAKTNGSTSTETGWRFGSKFNSQSASTNSVESVQKSPSSILCQKPTDLRVFTIAEMKTATKRFNRSCMVGEGGFGCVYRGVIKSLSDPPVKMDVAVKQLNKGGFQGHKEWVTEVNVLGIVEHINLVKLIGYCADDDERGIQRLLIYEFMPNGSVSDHLSPNSQRALTWPMRLKIAQDTARGLAYLHEGMDFQIIFRDFKSSNILLDEQWNAKLSDFGLARLGPTDGLTHVSTAVVGTMGYAAPEYIQSGRLSSKNDIWSYGVFLYELITGRRPLDRNRPRNEHSLLEWIKPHLTDVKKFGTILDPRIKGNFPQKSAQKLAIVANRCLAKNAKSRPKMSEVLEMVNRVVEASDGIESPQRAMEDLMPSETWNDDSWMKSGWFSGKWWVFW